MALPPGSTKTSLGYALQNVQNIADSAKTTASNAVTTLAAGSVDTTYVFKLLDQLKSLIDTLNTSSAVSGLDAYATAQIPNYTGTLSSDITATKSAAQACIDWVVTNFPKDSTATYLLAQSLNNDGTRTSRSFSSAQTAGLRTALNNLIATIG